jgi:hypothetical protein
VTVVQNLETRKRPTEFSLIRWIPDPGIEIPEDEEVTTPSSSDDDAPSSDEEEEEEEGNQNSNGR